LSTILTKLQSHLDRRRCQGMHNQALHRPEKYIYFSNHPRFW
jgi:hypothetical protein